MDNRKLIHVVDDSQDNRDGLTCLLREMGYNVEGYANCDEALERLKAMPPHLYIIDVKMPGMSGLEMLQKLDTKNNIYEAIILTAYESLEDAKKAMDLGAVSYLGKPIVKEQLQEQVAKALGLVALKIDRLNYLTKLEIDINGRKKEVEETLKILENRDVMMDNIFNSLGEGVLVIDNEDSIIYMNAQAQDVTGLSFSECAGNNIAYALKDESLLRILFGFLEKEYGQLMQLGNVYVKTNESNENEYYAISVSDYTNTDNKIIGKVLNFKNETGKMHFERLRNSLLTIISHELRTPLNIIMNYVSLLKVTLNKTTDISEVLEDMHIIGNRLKYQINNVMSIAHLSDTSMVPTNEETDIIELIETQIKKLKIEAEERSVKTVIRNKLKNAKVITDTKILGIALASLLSNAIKFNKLKGLVEITIDNINVDGDTRLCIAISDQGIGIEPDQQKTLFESFVQVEDHMTRQYEGIGIGLFLVKRTMDILNGEVTVSSSKGGGSTFTLKIPDQRSYMHDELEE